MKNTKDILTENRESVISSIKFICKVWKSEDVRAKMIEFLAFAEKHMDIAKYEATKAKKTYLKDLVSTMVYLQNRESRKTNETAREMRGRLVADGLLEDISSAEYRMRHN